MGLEEVLAMKDNILPSPHTYPRSTVIKKAFDRAQKENQELTPKEVKELAKQTLLAVEMWIKHLSSVKERRKAGARKAAATRKARKKVWWKRNLHCC